LLRKIGDIGGENGEDAADESICTHHVHALLAGCNQGLEKEGHAVVE
jgi:hypothetical protein